METITPVIMLLTLAAVGEVVIESLKPLLEPLLRRIGVSEEGDEQAYLYLSTLIGLGLSFIYAADVLAAIGLEPPNQAAVIFGQVATGLLLGRGSAVVHKAINRLGGVTGGDTLITANIEERAYEPYDYGEGAGD